ncbi:MAG: hypothetical protein J5711_01735 [Bacteroidales bacterium]|nr:hypothetical protein [Bacteroidales bacterium]
MSNTSNVFADYVQLQDFKETVEKAAAKYENICGTLKTTLYEMNWQDKQGEELRNTFKEEGENLFKNLVDDMRQFCEALQPKIEALEKYQNIKIGKE